MNNMRSDRLSALIQREVSDILRNEIKDPRIGELCSVLRTELSGDLSYCKVYITIYGNEAEQKDAFKGVKAAAPFIRRQLAGRLTLRKVPELKFVLDDSIAYSVRIGQLIDQINAGEDKNEK